MTPRDMRFRPAYTGGMTKLEKANRAIEAATVDPVYRHRYHAMPPAGWMNDPNGLCRFKGEYHLFYQHNPYAPRWGKMHWGHSVSRDFVRWEDWPIALAPDKRYESFLGCFSGSALVVGGGASGGGELKLMYTAVSAFGQRQCAAASTDGRTFVKDDANPLIGARQLPRGRSLLNFRDPKLFEREGRFYCLVASSNSLNRSSEGELLLFRSDNFRDWEYVGVTYSCPESPMLECPDLSIVGGADLLLFSPTELPRRGDEFQNYHSAVCSHGELDLSSGRFAGGPYRELDSGFDFYAPQTLVAEDGRVVMIAWMQMWKRSMPTEAHGWAGAMTLPRELSLVGDRLFQKPVREIESYRRDRVAYGGFVVEGSRRSPAGELRLPGVEGSSIELLVEADVSRSERFELRVFCPAKGLEGSERGAVIAWDRATHRLSFDRGAAGEPIFDLLDGRKSGAVRYRALDPEGGILRLRVFLDVSSVEVFAQGGEITMTGNVYPRPGDVGVEFASEGPAMLRSVEKYDIEPS